MFGSLECQQACDPKPAGARSITVHGAGGFGSGQVVTASEADAPGDGDG